MWSTKDEITKAVADLFEFCKSRNRGDTLLLTEIEDIAGCRRYEGRWLIFVKKMRRRIRDERGIALRSIHGVGYRFCEEDEQLKWCARNRRRRALRQINQGFREIEVLDADSLTVHQQQLRAITLQHMIRERREVKRGLRRQTEEIRKTETLPSRFVAAGI